MKIKKLGVHIKVKNIKVSYPFYKSFGLIGVFVYGDKDWLNEVKEDFNNIGTADEKYNGITFELGNSLLEIANGHVAVKKETFMERISSSKVSAMIDVDSVDEVVELCKKNKYEIAVGIKEYPWGTKEVVIRDPDGFILVFREVKYM